MNESKKQTREEFLDEIEAVLNELWVSNVMKRSALPGPNDAYMYIHTEKAHLAPGGPYETYEEYKERTSKLN
jgi:hypothetical protein